MSKNESVSLSIIEKICDTLDCQIEDILEIVHKPRNERWMKIEDNELYLIDLFYIVEQHEDSICNVGFLYGYAIATEKSGELKRKIEINKRNSTGAFSVYEMKHQITGTQLKTYLQCIEDGETIDTFLKKLSTKQISWEKKQINGNILFCLFLFITKNGTIGLNFY